MNRLILAPYWIERKKEYYRFITSGFIHADYLHLAFNMISLYFFGDQVESSIGREMYLLLYVLGLIISDIPTYLKNKNNSNYTSLGASGAVSSVIFASIVFYPVREICLYGFICFSAFIFGILYLGYSYYMDRRNSGHINHSAHFYGAVVGLVFVALINTTAFISMFIVILNKLQSFLG
jgi:membrane associated rhomboid family serine protease